MHPFSKSLRRLAPLALLVAVACQKDPAAPSAPDGPANFKKTVALANATLAPVAVTELTDGSLFVLGTATSLNATSNEGKPLGLKLTAAGDTVWSRRYPFGLLDGLTGYGLPFTCLPTPDGNVVICGAGNTGPGQYRSFVTKLNTATGAVLWTATTPADIFSGVSRIVGLSDGGFLLLNRDPQGPPQTFNLHPISATGTLGTSTIHAGDIASAICPTADGNFIIAGVNEPYVRNQVYLVKVTPLGTELWRQTPGADHFGVVNSLAQTADGGFAVASGFANVFSGNIQLLRTDANGQQLTASTVGNGLQGQISSLTAGPANTLLMAGSQEAGTAGGGALFLRTSITGAEQLRKSSSTTTGGASTLCKTRLGNLILCSGAAGKLEVQRTNPDLTD